jgi:hypothetical protein
VRLGAALETQARQHGCKVEARIADPGVVPVEEHGAAGPEAEVVAADVAVQDGLARERGPVARGEQHRQRALEPARPREPE